MNLCPNCGATTPAGYAFCSAGCEDDGMGFYRCDNCFKYECSCPPSRRVVTVETGEWL